jgi:hypothetical protein
MNIEAKLDKASKNPSVDSGKMQQYSKAFGAMAQSILDLIEKADEKAGDKLEKFFTRLATGINKLIDQVDEKKATALGKIIEKITKGVLGYAFWLTISIPLLITANIGAFLFGLSVKLLLLGIGQVNPGSIEAAYYAAALGWEVLRFGAVMTLYTILAIPALIGATLFGLTVKILSAIVKSVDEQSISNAYLASLLGWSVLKFGFIMSLYLIFSVPALVATTLFATTILILHAIVKRVDQESLDKATMAAALGWRVLQFGFFMTLYIILAVPAMIGAILFGLTVRLLLLTAGVASAKGRKAIEAVSHLGIGVLWFGIALALYLIIGIPAMLGAILFGLTVRLLLLVSGAAKKKGRQGIAAVSRLGKGILMFGLVLLLYLIIGIPAFVGALLFALTVLLIGLVLRFVSSKKAKRGIKNLLKLGMAIILFGLIIYVWNKTIKLMDVLMLAGGLAIIALVVILWGIFSKPINKGSKALMKAAPAIILMGIAMVVWMFAKATWEQIAMLAATIAAIGTIAGVLGIFDKFVKKGAGALIIASVAVIAMSVGMLIWMQAKVKWEQIAMLGATFVVMGLIATVAGIGPIPGFIAAGSVALGLASVAVIAMSLGMTIWMKAKVKMPDVGVLGATLGMLGVEFGIFGAAAIFIGLGAAAMLLTVPTLLAVTGAVAVFKSTKFTKGDADVMEYTLSAVANGFMGGSIPGGLIAAIKFAAKAAARAALVGISALAFIPAGISLIMISKALKTFKESKFNRTDADNMEFAIGAVIRAFSLIGDSERKKKMGITATYFDIIMGIAALANAGDTLANLAKGVQAWANLTVIEYEVINGGTKDAKIVPKGKVKLSKSDFDLAAYGMSQVIKSIAEPFAQVGRLESGLSPSGNITSAMILGNVYGRGRYVSKGVQALAGAGNVLTELARSTQKWANLKVAEFEVVNAGTKDAKLVIKGYTSLSKTDIDNAIKNQATIVSAVGAAFAEVGRLEEGDPPSPALGAAGQFMHAIFGGKRVTKGVKALSKAGNVLSTLADTTKKWAGLSVAEYEVVDGGSKDAKLVIKGYRKLSQSEIENSIKNQLHIVSSVGAAFAEVGRLEEGDPPSPALGAGGQFMHAIFGGRRVSKGVAAIARTGTVLSQLAMSVKQWAGLKVAEYEVVGAGTKDAKLVIKEYRNLTPMEVAMAGFNMTWITGMVGKTFAEIGKLDSGESSDDTWLSKIFGKMYVAKGVAALSRAGAVMSSLAVAVKNWSSMSVAEFEVVNAGTPNAKLVIKEYRKITPGEIKQAMRNMSHVALSTASVFANIGSGLGVPGFKFVNQESLKKGIDFVQPAANALKSMADSIAAMVKLEFVENTVVKGKIVPLSVRKITPADLVKAGVNISTLALFMASMMAKIGGGNAKDPEGKTVREEDIKKGIKFITDISSPIQRMAETIAKIANMEVVENVVKGGKVVPGQVTKLDPTKIALAAANADLFVNLFARILVKAGKDIAAQQQSIDHALEILPSIFTVISNMTNPINKWGEVKEFDKGMKRLESFHQWITTAFDPKTNAKIVTSDKYFQSFASNAKLLADSANGVKTFADNAQKVAEAMKQISINVNMMDLKKLTLTSSMFNAIALMSKNPEAIAKAIAASMNKSFEELIKALKEMAGANGGGGGGGGGGDTPPGNNPNPPGNNPNPPKGSGKDKKETKTSAGVQKVWIVGKDV